MRQHGCTFPFGVSSLFRGFSKRDWDIVISNLCLTERGRQPLDSVLSSPRSYVLSLNRALSKKTK